MKQLDHAPGAIHMRNALAADAKIILNKLNMPIKKQSPDNSQITPKTNDNAHQKSKAQSLNESLAQYARQLDYNYKNNLGSTFDIEIYDIARHSADSIHTLLPNFSQKYGDKVELWSKEGIGALKTCIYHI